MLTLEEQAAFRRLAVFAGGCSLDAALRVTTLDLDSVLTSLAPPAAGERLVALAEKHLLRWERTDEDPPGERIAMLDTIHDYAKERLRESGEESRTCDSIWRCSATWRSEPNRD